MSNVERFVLYAMAGLALGLGIGSAALIPKRAAHIKAAEAATGDYVTDAAPVVQAGKTEPAKYMKLDADHLSDPSKWAVTATRKAVHFNEPYTCLELKTDSGVWHLVAEDEWTKLQVELEECRKAKETPTDE